MHTGQRRPHQQPHDESTNGSDGGPQYDTAGAPLNGPLQRTPSTEADFEQTLGSLVDYYSTLPPGALEAEVRQSDAIRYDARRPRRTRPRPRHQVVPMTGEGEILDRQDRGAPQKSRTWAWVLGGFVAMAVGGVATFALMVGPKDFWRMVSGEKPAASAAVAGAAKAGKVDAAELARQAAAAARAKAAKRAAAPKAAPLAKGTAAAVASKGSGAPRAEPLGSPKAAPPTQAVTASKPAAALAAATEHTVDAPAKARKSTKATSNAKSGGKRVTLRRSADVKRKRAAARRSAARRAARLKRARARARARRAAKKKPAKVSKGSKSSGNNWADPYK